MTEQEAAMQLTASFLRYGAAGGMDVGAVLKGILKDFSHMAREAGSLRRISEEYRTDDGSYVIELAGGWDGQRVIYEKASVRKL